MSKKSAYFALDNIGGKRGAEELRRELDRFPGVISVSVNPETNSLAVDFDSTGASPDRFAERITELGYHIGRQKTIKHMM